jgi:hypothetical protein
MKRTLLSDSAVKRRKIDESVTPVSIEYARKSSVAVRNDMLPILAEMNHISPNWAMKIMISGALLLNKASIMEALLATTIAVSPEMTNAHVIHRYTLLRIPVMAFWSTCVSACPPNTS